MAVSDEVRPARAGARGAARPARPTHATLDAIANRILWLAVRMIHEANHVRPSTDGIKVGGHQASSASVVSILTALYFRWLRAGDLVAIKPHASPAYHSLQYLLGNLDASMLTRLREFGGLQSYPSRTKDPDPVDFSTGSVGLGAVAPMFAALADRYLRLHFREIDREPAGAPVRGAGRRRGARRGQRLGGDPRGGPGRARQRHDDRRPQPPEPGPGRARHPHPAGRGHVRGGRLARHRGEVRAPAPGTVRAPRRRGAPRADRRHGERGLPDPHPPAGSGAARAPAGGRHPGASRRPRPERAGRPGRRPAGAHRRPRRARPGGAGAGLPRVRRRDDTADRDLRLHDQGLAPAVRRRQPQPLGAPRRRPGRPARARPRDRPRRCLGRVRSRLAGGQAGDAPAHRARLRGTARPDRTDPGARDRDAGHPDRPGGQHPAGVRRHPRRTRARSRRSAAGS